MKLEKLLERLDDFDEVIMKCFDELEEYSLKYFDSYIDGFSTPEKDDDGSWYVHIDVKVPIGKYKIKTIKKIDD